MKPLRMSLRKMDFLIGEAEGDYEPAGELFAAEDSLDGLGVVPRPRPAQHLESLQADLERYAAATRAFAGDPSRIDPGGPAPEEREAVVLETFREVLALENEMLNRQIAEQDRRRQRLDGVILEVADQLAAFRRLQRFVRLLAAIEGLLHRAVTMRRDPGDPPPGLTPRRLAHCSETLRLEEEDPAWSEESCVICLVDFAEHDEVRQMRCAHFYHVMCIDRWFTGATTCPICKTDYGAVSPAEDSPGPEESPAASGPPSPPRPGSDHYLDPLL